MIVLKQKIINIFCFFSPVELKSTQDNNIIEGEVSIFANCITLLKVLPSHFSKKRVKVIIIDSNFY